MALPWRQQSQRYFIRQDSYSNTGVYFRAAFGLLNVAQYSLLHLLIADANFHSPPLPHPAFNSLNISYSSTGIYFHAVFSPPSSSPIFLLSFSLSFPSSSSPPLLLLFSSSSPPPPSFLRLSSLLLLLLSLLLFFLPTFILSLLHCTVVLAEVYLYLTF